MKAAVYCGTRNVYEDMIPSMKSLLIHSDVDKIYFLIEDDEFPYPLPPEVECINVSNQQWFPEDGPNMKNRCSYMVLLRAAFTKIFPDLDMILTIDNDTIVKENISELWELPMENYYFAGCQEFRKTTPKFLYINMGVAMINLKKLREDKKDDELIYNLNHYKYWEAEQSCINQTCEGHIMAISSDYNSNNYTKMNNKREKIKHFAATKDWQTFPLIQKYRDIKIVRNIKEETKLDIIVPSYNDTEGLESTLNSIYYNDLPEIQITVVDDCSNNVDIESFKENYPRVNFIQLKENSGPGIARQTGIENTSGSHIMFIDCGDYIISKYNLIEILAVIKNRTTPYIFSYAWINEEDNHYFYNEKELLPGKIIKREFLELYNISFAKDKKCSYSNEDRGFLISCNLILKDITRFEKISHYTIFETPIYFRTYNKNSITNSNKREFFYRQHIKGTVYNNEHAVQICQKNNVYWPVYAQKIAETMLLLYTEYLRCAKEKPEYLEENLEYIKYFYKNIYSIYEKVLDKALNQIYSNYMPTLKNLISPRIPRININKFLEELKC